MMLGCSTLQVIKNKGLFLSAQQQFSASDFHSSALYRPKRTTIKAQLLADTSMKNRMEKQINLAHFLKEEIQPSLSIFAILRDAFNITIKNGKLVLLIAFIMLSYYSVLEVANHVVLAPVLMSDYTLVPNDVNFSEIDPSLRKAIIKDVQFFLIFELVVFAFSCLILMSSLTALTHSTYEAYTAKGLILKEMLLSIRSRWKRPLITTFWMVFISLVSIIVFFFIVGVIALMAEGSLLYALVIVLVILGLCYYVYLSALWMLSLVVSVLENSSGLKAIDRANELMKGKRLQGCLLKLIFMLASGAIYLVFTILAISASKAKLDFLAINIPRTWSLGLLNLFVVVVYTMFYHECKRRHPLEDKTHAYLLISSTEV